MVTAASRRGRRHDIWSTQWLCRGTSKLAGLEVGFGECNLILHMYMHHKTAYISCMQCFRFKSPYVWLNLPILWALPCVIALNKQVIPKMIEKSVFWTKKNYIHLYTNSMTWGCLSFPSFPGWKILWWSLMLKVLKDRHPQNQPPDPRVPSAPLPTWAHGTAHMGTPQVTWLPPSPEEIPQVMCLGGIIPGNSPKLRNHSCHRPSKQPGTCWSWHFWTIFDCQD